MIGGVWYVPFRYLSMLLGSQEGLEGWLTWVWVDWSSSGQAPTEEVVEV